MRPGLLCTGFPGSAEGSACHGREKDGYRGKRLPRSQQHCRDRYPAECNRGKRGAGKPLRSSALIHDTLGVPCHLCLCPCTDYELDLTLSWCRSACSRSA